jgi:RHS repeat-associated protein
LSQTVNGTVTNYTLDLNSGLTQVLSDGTTSYTYGLGRISQTSTTTEYFLGDALGSVRQLTNNAGEVTYAKSYDPYGVVTQVNGAGRSAYGYTGEQQSNDMVYLRSRYYNVADGRFLSRDTWEGDENSPMSFNMWLYGYGNPILNNDPSGYCPEPKDESDTCWQLLLQIENQYSFIDLQSELSKNNYWTYDELLNIQEDLERYNRAAQIGLTTLYPDDVKIKRVRKDTYFGRELCGGTPAFFTKGRSISMYNDFKQRCGSGAFVHELAHYLDDANLHLAKPFENYIGASTILWIIYNPGKESPPIYGGGDPPDRSEDFAESLTEYVLLYTNYSGLDIGIIPGQKRWYFVESLFNTGNIPLANESSECAPNLGVLTGLSY